MDKDAFSRMNYLYQIANLTREINPFLSRNYLKEMNLISEKRVLRKYQIIIYFLKSYTFITEYFKEVKI